MDSSFSLVALTSLQGSIQWETPIRKQKPDRSLYLKIPTCTVSIIECTRLRLVFNKNKINVVSYLYVLNI